MADTASNEEGVKAEMVATMRIMGNTLTLLLTETTVKGELAAVASECIQWLSAMKKLLADKLAEFEIAKECPVLLDVPETGK